MNRHIIAHESDSKTANILREGCLKEDEGSNCRISYPSSIELDDETIVIVPGVMHIISEHEGGFLRRPHLDVTTFTVPPS
ncbi:unnamed protein product [marine sediment metagenome]|uniref:Uncharacterized protein n=1 Tax=marine sediment metagenome TaxID=412755 RepID=X0RGS2_9ZZZZ